MAVRAILQLYFSDLDDPCRLHRAVAPVAAGISMIATKEVEGWPPPIERSLFPTLLPVQCKSHSSLSNRLLCIWGNCVNTHDILEALGDLKALGHARLFVLQDEVEMGLRQTEYTAGVECFPNAFEY